MTTPTGLSICYVMKILYGGKQVLQVTHLNYLPNESVIHFMRTFSNNLKKLTLVAQMDWLSG